jgi:predicted PurR-regulated permease PerM
MARRADPPGRLPQGGFDRAADGQRVARFILAAALGLLGLWILRPFVAALAWAVIIAIAAWPLFERIDRALAAAARPVLAPLAMTLLIALIFLLPFALFARELVRDMGGILAHLGGLRRSGVPVPEWLPQLPGLGRAFAQWWQANLADPQALQDLLGRAYGRIPTQTVREFGGEIIHRLALFGFTLLSLFFLFRDGADLGGRLIGLSHRVLGPGGERVGRHMIAAVHGTLNGLVLVGLAEGAALGGAYWMAGLPHPVSVGALTGVLAAIPFAAPVVFGTAALYLFAVGSRLAAGAVLVFGFVVVFIADHAVRPLVIGGAARLPFLWVLLGILGGLESFGFLGLFLGPVTLAALVSLWRDWTQDLPAAGRPVPAARQRPPEPA